MSRSDEDIAVGQTEIFDLLGSETRLAILLELANHRRVNWRMDGLRFAELRKAVAVRDAGNFSYHLDKLRGHFVIENDDEYILTNTGLEIADAILAGMYSDSWETRTAATDYTCPYCERTISATYERELLSLSCEEHGSLFATTLPSGATEERTMDELIRLATRDAQHDIENACDGVCFHCWGRMHASLAVEEPVRNPATDEIVSEARLERNDGLAIFGCERCGMVFWLHPEVCIVSHPSVVSFYDDHGVDIRGLPYLDSRYFGSKSKCTVESAEPVRVRIERVLDNEELCVTLDEDATIIETERE